MSRRVNLNVFDIELMKEFPVVAKRMTQVIFTCAGVLTGSLGFAVSSVQAAAAGQDAHHARYSIWSDLPFWSLIAFLGFIFAVKKLGLWNLLTRTMAEREQAESEAISIAENDLSGAQTLLRDAKTRIGALDQQVKEILAEAQRDADSTRKDLLVLAEQESETSLQRAKLEIDRATAQALDQIFGAVADQVTQTAEQRLRSGLSRQDHDRLIQESLSQAAIQ